MWLCLISLYLENHRLRHQVADLSHKLNLALHSVNRAYLFPTTTLSEPPSTAHSAFRHQPLQFPDDVAVRRIEEESFLVDCDSELEDFEVIDQLSQEENQLCCAQMAQISFIGNASPLPLHHRALTSAPPIFPLPDPRMCQ